MVFITFSKPKNICFISTEGAVAAENVAPGVEAAAVPTSSTSLTTVVAVSAGYYEPRGPRDNRSCVRT